MLQKNVLEYLEGSAARFPDKLAFTDEGESFTFGRMLACAQGLGTALANLSPRHNGPVAVLVDHTAANLTSFMGVLQSGNFYVPVDSQMPLPRIGLFVALVQSIVPGVIGKLGTLRNFPIQLLQGLVIRVFVLGLIELHFLQLFGSLQIFFIRIVNFSRISAVHLNTPFFFVSY